MKKLIITLILVPFFLLSCSNENSAIQPVDIYTIDLNDIQGTSLSNPVTIKLITPDGEEITDVTQLRPNLNYHLIVKGSGADFYRIKSCDGFEVIQNPSTTKSSSEDFVFIIKTTEEVVGELYVNIVPLHIEGKNILRESPQVFLLPG